MKKFIFVMMAFVMMSLASCGSKGVEYKNEKCGYSVTLPEGSHAQNDLAEFEEKGATKLFLGAEGGMMISFTFKELPTGDYAPTPEERIKSESAFFKERPDMAKIQKEEAADKVRVNYERETGALEGQIIKVANGNIMNVFFRYPAGMEQQLKEAMDLVDSTLKF